MVNLEGLAREVEVGVVVVNVDVEEDNSGDGNGHINYPAQPGTNNYIPIANCAHRNENIPENVFVGEKRIHMNIFLLKGVPTLGDQPLLHPAGLRNPNNKQKINKEEGERNDTEALGVLIQKDFDLEFQIENHIVSFTDLFKLLGMPETDINKDFHNFKDVYRYLNNHHQIIAISLQIGYSLRKRGLVSFLETSLLSVNTQVKRMKEQ